MKKTFLGTLLTVIILSLSSLTVNASEDVQHYNFDHVNAYSGTGIIVLKDEPAIHYDDAYTAWRLAKNPEGKVSSTNYSDMIIVDSTVPAEFDMGILNAYLDQIPQVAISTLRNNGWKIIVTSYPKTYYPIPLNIEIGGFCDTTAKMIVIPYDDAGRVVTHELGHAVFCANGFNIIDTVNKDWRLTNIGDSEAEIENVVLHTNETLYYYYDALEKYAEVFGEYIYYPLELQATAPTIFKIYNDIFGVY